MDKNIKFADAKLKNNELNLINIGKRNSAHMRTIVFLDQELTNIEKEMSKIGLYIHDVIHYVLPEGEVNMIFRCKSDGAFEFIEYTEKDIKKIKSETERVLKIVSKVICNYDDYKVVSSSFAEASSERYRPNSEEVFTFSVVTKK